jgi:DUF4097 and DUF4098 domain-containing protein YvlB
MFGDFEVARATRHTTIPVGAGPLEIRPDANGGVRIERGSGATYGVTACVGVGAPTRGEAQAAADSVTLELRAANGPIALDDVAGTVKAHANNGPISVRGSQGEFDVETANGPIDVRLDGRRWDGHLTARASNGPLSVAIPAGFESSVEVRSSAHSPWTCRVSACGSRSQGDDDRRRTLRLGSGPLVVDISTVNGPVTITDR